MSAAVFHSSLSGLTRLFQENANEPILSGSEGWRVGPGALEAKDLILVRLEHVSKGSWQAEFQATTG
jgi:hypothetical protein